MTLSSPHQIDPEVVAIIERRTPAERHAIARLLDTQGEALHLIAWIAAQPDCDVTTASMIFWRLWSLPDDGGDAAQDAATRNAVLLAVLERLRTGTFAPPTMAWDGYEAWARIPLIGAPRVAGILVQEDEIPAALHGPFGTCQPEPAWEILLDEDSIWEEYLEPLWRRHRDAAGVCFSEPHDVDATEYLLTKGDDVWLAAIDDLTGSYPDHLYLWMLRQPECPASAAHRMARIYGSDWAATRRIHLSDEPQPEIRPVARPDDYKYYCLIAHRQNLTPCPRAEISGSWQSPGEVDLAWHGYMPEAQRTAPEDTRPATIVERFCYGGKYVGSRAQMDRCWRRFNVITVAGSVLLVVLARVGPRTSAIWLFFALTAFVSIAQSSWKMGPVYRLLLWWLIAIGVGFALIGVFRSIDFPHR